MWNKEFRFTLIENESKDMYEEINTENFEMPFNEVVIRNVKSIEEAIEEFKERCKIFSNEDWDWESNEEGTMGEIRTGNNVDGLSVVFEIEK
ncbi:hypothetical protein RVS70_05430 [Virgibacillus sp. M23]|uniref:hypothetical protein n=1 Tax=Virgibacillus sp. M23 TaxID=3079030 RepID=UPI002A92004A|nr:hypothetical protein [Virgibacillus sp. M23]MDY7043643.1 hypothetical protein [Virgibacillus sp. M23]